jgi:hypothetical protein
MVYGGMREEEGGFAAYLRLSHKEEKIPGVKSNIYKDAVKGIE